MRLTRFSALARRYAPYTPAHAVELEPGIAAMVHRHPAVVRRSALGSVTAGVMLLIFNTLSTAFASTPTHTHAAPPAVAKPHVGAAAAIQPAAPGPTASSPPLAATPVAVSKPAPATHQVISGLAANGIPNVALNAYRVAAARLHNVDPGCGIDWALLAGIGREESDHGRFGGAMLHADGTSTPHIIGPALTGTPWDYIPAPANGMALDGDAVYAHALGPMQFIPSTWAEYGVDGNGDGKADIFNINDAALTAGRYLCAAGGNLRTQAGQVRAVLAYNHNSQYLTQVLALAQAYRTGVDVTGIPVGQLTGALPPVHNVGSAPPANPGGPTANESSTAPTAAHSAPGTPPSTGHSPAGGSATPAPTPVPTKSGPPTSTATSHSAKPTPTKPTPSPTATCKLNLLKLCILK